MILTVTWSIQTLSVPSRVIPSPPQTYCCEVSETEHCRAQSDRAHLRVDVRDLDVLDDNVGSAVHDTKTLALDDTAAAVTDNRLVGSNSDTKGTSSIVGDGVDSRSIRLVVLAPAVLVNGGLATGGSALIIVY